MIFVLVMMSRQWDAELASMTTAERREAEELTDEMRVW
jgi:hypothetical protein